MSFNAPPPAGVLISVYHQKFRLISPYHQTFGNIKRSWMYVITYIHQLYHHTLRKKVVNTDIFFSVFSRIPNGIQEKTEMVIFVYRIPVQTNRDSDTAFWFLSAYSYTGRQDFRLQIRNLYSGYGYTGLSYTALYKYSIFVYLRITKYGNSLYSRIRAIYVRNGNQDINITEIRFAE